MNRSLSILAVTLFALLTILPALALADDMPPAEHKSIGLGFHDVDAPVGVRWWLAGQKVGIDLGVGFSSESATLDGYPNDNTSSLAFSAGVPIVVKSWERVHVLFRPGFFYHKEEVVVSDGFATPTPEPFATQDIKTIRISGELEAEVFLMSNLSVSASHGIAYESVDFGGPDKQTSFGTLGNNFTDIGFHMYLFGTGSH
jgi:hypothetical protein